MLIAAQFQTFVVPTSFASPPARQRSRGQGEEKFNILRCLLCAEEEEHHPPSHQHPSVYYQGDKYYIGTPDQDSPPKN